VEVPRTFRIIPILLLLPMLCWAQSEPAKKAAEQNEDHQASIHGIRIGMTTEQVLERLGGRMPDARKDEKGEIIVFWKLEGGNVLQVNFRKENYVSHIALQFHPPRPTNDFWLVKLKDSTHEDLRQSAYRPSSRAGLPETAQQSRTPVFGEPGPGDTGVSTAMAMEGKAPGGRTLRKDVEAPDPRWRLDYKASETSDRERTVWVREGDAEDGYRVQISFLSAHKKRLGDRFEEEVEFKYVTVNRNDLKKFDQSVAGKK